MGTDGTRGKKGAGGAPQDSDQLATGINANAESCKILPDQPVVNGTEPFKVSLSGNSLDVTLHGTPTYATDVQGFWEYLRTRTDMLSFGEYDTFIKEVLCKGAVPDPLKESVAHYQTETAARGVDSYELLRVATEAFLLLRCGTITVIPTQSREVPFEIAGNPFGHQTFSASRFGGASMDLTELKKKLGRYVGKNAIIPYIDRITEAYVKQTQPATAPNVENPVFCDDIDAKVLQPCFIELIWSYWHEEAALVQTINAISLRFQNKRGPGDNDPLANLETHPLRPLANLLWGYVQDEDHRLTVARRSYEYEHQYGFSLVGKAVPRRAPADRRSQFLVAFHTLLHQAAIFYDRSANLTVRADAFPLLNALREVHLVLAEGAHNQFRELPWTARVEMLMQQWLLSRREVREFVGGRPAVPYAEEWMRTVDAMRRLMGWGDTSISNFHDLAITGEKIVLSIRFGDWSDTKLTESEAAGWAVFWRPEIQRYIHSYHAVTGVDLSAATQTTNRQIDATLPSVLLQQRMARQRR